jgi:hypothetical protein
MIIKQIQLFFRYNASHEARLSLGKFVRVWLVSEKIRREELPIFRGEFFR